MAGLMKVELGGKIKTKFFGFSEKTDSYVKDDGREDKKAKGTKKCAIKKKPTFENYKHCLEETQHDNKVNYLEKMKLT